MLHSQRRPSLLLKFSDYTVYIFSLLFMPATLPVHFNIIFYNRGAKSVAHGQHVARDTVLFCLRHSK